MADIVVRDIIDKDIIAKDVVAKDIIDKDIIVKDIITKEVIAKDILAKDLSRDAGLQEVFSQGFLYGLPPLHPEGAGQQHGLFAPAALVAAAVRTQPEDNAGLVFRHTYKLVVLVLFLVCPTSISPGLSCPPQS